MRTKRRLKAVLTSTVAFILAVSMWLPSIAGRSAQAAGGSAQEDWKEDGVLKILAIGNSFSVDSMQYVYDIAKSAGVENIVLGNMVIGGCTLDMHADNAASDQAAYQYWSNTDGTWKTKEGCKLSEVLTSENWDFVTIQQASGSSGRPDTYGRLEELIRYIEARIPRLAKIAWNMTWAYQQDSTHPEFANYRNDQMTMYNSITKTVQEKILTNRKIDLVIPGGTAIQNARTSYVGDHMTMDGFHLSQDFGRYVAGVNFLYALTGIPLEDITFVPAVLNQGHREIALESARNAAATPFAVTKSLYTETKTETVEKALISDVKLLEEANVAGANVIFNATWTGMQITVGDKDIELTEVGRYYTPECKKNWDFLILNDKLGVVRDGISTVVPDDAQEGFLYAKLPEEKRVTLQKNTTYYVLTHIEGNRDKFYSYTQCTTTVGANIGGFIYLAWVPETSSWSWRTIASANNSWGPVDIKYEIEETTGVKVDPPVEPEQPEKPEEPSEPGKKKELITDVNLLEAANVEGANLIYPAGWVGMKITVGDKDIVLTDVGRYCTPESSKNCNFIILDEEQLVVRDGISAVVPDNAGSGFVYAQLTEDQKVTLQKNTTYYIVTDIKGANDKFYSYTQCTATGDASVDGFMILEYQQDINDWRWKYYESAANSWGPVNIKYEVKTDGGEGTDPEKPTTDPEKPTTDPEKPTTDPEKPTPEEPVKEMEKKNLVTNVKLLEEANVEGANLIYPAGWVGMKITVGNNDIVLTGVGRYYTPESSKNCNFIILDEKQEVVRDGISTVVPDNAGSGFVYAQLTENQKVTLQKNTTYYIVTDIKGERDKFYSYTQCTTTRDASIDGFMILEWQQDINDWRWKYYEGANNSWGPVDIQYEIEKGAVPKTGEDMDWRQIACFCGILVGACGAAFVYKKQQKKGEI